MIEEAPLRKSSYVACALATAAVACGQGRLDSSIDLAPAFTEDALVGEWRYGDAILTLAADGRYTCVGGGECELLGVNGRWLRRGEYELEFRDRPDAAVWRSVVKYRKRYRLTEPEVNVDTWNGDLTFELTSPAT